MIKKLLLSLFLLLLHHNSFAEIDTWAGQDLSGFEIIGDGTLASWAGQTISSSPDVTVYPSADVGTSWTPLSGTTRWEMVDEVTADGDTTYIYRQESGSAQLFSNLPTLTSSSPILGVSVCYTAKQQTGTTTGINRIVVNGTTYSSAGDSMTSAYAEYCYEWTVNPDTSLAWTKADVEGTGANPLQQWGVGSSIQAGEEMRITQVKLPVRYN